MVIDDIDPEYFHGTLPESDERTRENWIPQWQNRESQSPEAQGYGEVDRETVKHINRMVTTYIRDECGKLPFLSRAMNPDLKMIATEGSQEDTIKVSDETDTESSVEAETVFQLLKAVLLAAMYNEKSNRRMIEVMERLGTKVALPIAKAIGDMEALDRRLAEYGIEQELDAETDHSPDPESAAPEAPSFGRDPELEREEKFITAYTRIKELEAGNAKLRTDFEAVYDRAKALEDELTEMKFEMENKGHKLQESEMVQQMKQKIAKDKDYISEIEANLSSAQALAENQVRQLERYKADAESKQELRDELQLTKSERDELLQKAKANENLKKKIQALQDQERANVKLREDLRVQSEQLQELDALRERCLALQRANEESLETISNGEREIFDQKATRKRLEHELLVMSQKFEAGRERQTRDHETITELEEKIQELESSQASRAQGLGNLDEELAATEKDDDTQVLKVALKWNRMLTLSYRKKVKSTPTPATADTIILQQKLDVLQSRVSSLETQYLDVYQENLGLQGALQDAQAQGIEGCVPASPTRSPDYAKPSFSDSAFLHQRNQLKAVTDELSS